MEVVDVLIESRVCVGEDGFMGLRVIDIVDSEADVEASLVVSVEDALGFGRCGCRGWGIRGRVNCGCQSCLGLGGTDHAVVWTWED